MEITIIELIILILMSGTCGFLLGDIVTTQMIKKEKNRKNPGCDRCGVNDRQIGRFCYKCHGEMLAAK